MNRNYITLFFILLLTLGMGGYVYLKKLDKTTELVSVFELIPRDFASEIIEITAPAKNLEELFNTNLIWKEIEKSSNLKQLEDFWNLSDSSFNEIKNEAVTLFYFKKERTKEEFYVFNFEKQPNVIKLKGWQTKVIGNYLLLTNAANFSELITADNKTVSLESEEGFTSVYKTRGKGDGKINVFQKKNGVWSVFDLTFLSEQIFTNGFTPNLSHSNTLNSNLDLSVFSLIPSQFQTLKLIHFDSVNQIKKDTTYLKSKEKTCNCDMSYYAYNWMESPLVYFKSHYQNSHYTLFKLTSISDFKESMNAILPDSLKLYEDDNSVIRAFNQAFDYSSMFGSDMQFNYFVRVDDYVMFSEQKLSLERLLFQQFSKFTIADKEDLNSFLKNNINKKSGEVTISEGLKYWNFDVKSGIEITQSHVESQDLIYKSMLYSKEINLDGGKTNPKWKIEFKTPLLSQIYVVNNHRTKDKDYLVQDNKNVIYFITPNGETKWKRDIGNPIVGKIKNIDILGNDKYQLIFNTKNQLYVIDVLGRNVTNFPVKILDSATANVSVMDYDKNLNFRFLVPTTQGIKSINKQGEIVKGWNQPKQANGVVGDIRHLLINNLDYIQAQDAKGNLYFYNRKGEVRHSVTSTFNNTLYTLHGSSISQTRAIYFDSVSNSIKRQFFSDKGVSVLLSPAEKIKEFFFVDYDNDNNRDFVLVFENQVKIYGQDLILQQTIELPNTISQFNIWEGGYGFLNQFGDLTLTQGEETKIIEGAKEYRIDFYKNTIRVIVKGDNDFKLLHI